MISAERDHLAIAGHDLVMLAVGRRSFRTFPSATWATPEEVAGLIIDLASEEATFVVGANIAIDGGQYVQ